MYNSVTLLAAKSLLLNNCDFPAWFTILVASMAQEGEPVLSCCSSCNSFSRSSCSCCWYSEVLLNEYRLGGCWCVPVRET